ncbi:MAG: DUF1887 family protein, partial [Oscillospiraceae bacterium]|nr:DUF1887 family protein [Oscillospiraceae bacterium]
AVYNSGDTAKGMIAIMETLIELFDERPLENVLGVEMFRPKRVVYICPDDTDRDLVRKRLRKYFTHRGLSPELVFVGASVYDSNAMKKTLCETAARYPDCAMDITGGTDAALFAAGRMSAESRIPVFTYSRRMNRFYDILNAPFAAGLDCGVEFCVEDFFIMAGGSMRSGRVDNAILKRYLGDIDPFFKLYLRYRKRWTDIVTYVQRVSPGEPDRPVSLLARGSYTVKGERGSRISAPEEALEALRDIGFIDRLEISPADSVSFRFRDEQIRRIMRDVGSVLELYVYKACLDSGLFDDVHTSAVVDWESDRRLNAVSNELDVVCSKGVMPVFISCKTGEVKTEALNELAVLRDRFGGKMAKAAIVTAERGSAGMRNRAGELNIDVVDLDDLAADRINKRLAALMRKEK